MKDILEKAIVEGRKTAMAKLADLEAQGPKWRVVDDPNFTVKPKVYGTMLDLCGFAHIKVSGRNSLVSWIKKHAEKDGNGDYKLETQNGRVRLYRSYKTGYNLYLPVECGRQEISVLTAGYEGALRVLAEHGIDGYVVSRLD